MSAWTTCKVLFCHLDAHEGDQHVDVTGHTWTEPTPAEPVVAHALCYSDHAEDVRTKGSCDYCGGADSQLSVSTCP